MNKTIMKYNPAFLTPKELVNSFVVRKNELDTIVQIIKDNTTKSNQHVLVVGPRGSGKTTLLLRVAEEVRRVKDLNDKWYPLVFSEESYSVVTCGEFWLESLLHLAHQTKDGKWQKTYDELLEEKDDKRLRERALAQLMDFADKQDKRIILVVENLNMLLGDQMNDEEAWALRHTLLNEPRVTLLASATSRFEQVNVEGKPMFELFRFLDLKPLTGAECRELWVSITGNKPDDARVRPLEILTGGNPRLMAIVSNFAAKMSLKNLMDDLLQLVDEHTEYFKSHLDNLPPTERKVYIALAEIWDPATAKQVAESSRLEVSKTSALLARLMERGAVVEANGKGKAKLYQVAERMYNIYYLMRKRGDTSRRVRAVVNFMTGFYATEELVKVVKGIAEEACQLDPTGRCDHYAVYEGILQQIQPKELKSLIFILTPTTFFDGPEVPVSLKKIFDAIKLPRKLFETMQKYGSIKNNLKELDSEKRYYYDYVRDHPKDYLGLISLGIFLHTCVKRSEEAEKIIREAIRINPKEFSAWFILAEIQNDRNLYEQAESAYINAIKVYPKTHDSYPWVRLGLLYQNKLHRFEDAERAYRKALEIEPQNKGLWQMLGFLLGNKLKRYKDAENVLYKAIEMDPSNEETWHLLGGILRESKNFEKAEEIYRKAIEFVKDPSSIWNDLGSLLMIQQRLNESEKCFRKAIELDDKQYLATLSLILVIMTDPSRLAEWQKILKEITGNSTAIKKNVEIVAEWFIIIAAMERGREALEVLRESAWAEALEPVVVALRLMQGEDVKAAAEIMEVAKDVVKRIEETRKQLQSAKKDEVKK